MKSATEAADEAMDEVEKARKRVAKGGSKQVAQADELDNLRAVAYAWFNSHRKVVLKLASQQQVQEVDRQYQKVLDSTAKTAARTTYLSALKAAKRALANLRTALVLTLPEVNSSQESSPPSFAGVAGDARMQAILEERWQECERCLSAGAYLAATVMMGGLLEALFVARANQMIDKQPLFAAKTTPIDAVTKKPLQLPKWTLRPYIDVGHELGWITRSGRDVAEVLRDYRNYVHPEKQRAHDVSLHEQDGTMLWDVTRNLTFQLLGLPTTKK